MFSKKTKCVLSHFNHIWFLRSHELWPARLFCPWDSPGKNTGVDCHFLLQVIIPTQGSNPGLLHCRWILYRLSHQGSQFMCVLSINIYPIRNEWQIKNFKLTKACWYNIFQRKKIHWEWCCFIFSENSLISDLRADSWILCFCI